MILGTIFLGVGIFLFLIGLVVDFGVNANRRRIMQDAIPVTAVIIEIEPRLDSGRAIIEYEVNGIVVRAPLSYWSSAMFVGQHRNIYVERQNPHNFVSTGILHRLPLIILGSLGFIFATIGAVFLLVERNRRRKFEWLLHYGTPVWAEVLGTDSNWSIVINGRPATVLVAEYNNMRFVSHAIDNNDLQHIGDHVKVLYDPNNANKYVFDFKNESFLQPMEQPKKQSGGQQ